MMQRIAYTCAAALALAAAGCGNPEHVLDTLPPPQRQTPPPRYPTYTPRTYSNAWPRYYPRPVTPAPRPSIPLATGAAEPGWRPAIGISERWRCVVIHHAASEKATPMSMDAYHRKRGWDELGYHFVIGNGQGYADGKVYVGPRWTKQKHGAHCKTPGGYYNQYGIGICLMGNMDNHRPTEKQMQSLARLVAFLERQCGIGHDKVFTHGKVTGKTRCPGRHFSLPDLYQRISRGY